MELLGQIIIYIVFVGFAIAGAYSLGFKMGEDKGRRDMLNEIAKPTHKGANS